MELKVNEIMIPEVITFNYQELKNELTEKVKKYETLVYTEDQIKEAKADRASLNKLKAAINDERLKREREYMAPFIEFKAQIADIISIIDQPIALIDKQVKEYEEKRKADKRIEIGSLFESIDDRPDWLRLPQLFDERWLNASYSMKQIEADLRGWVNRIKSELETLASLPEFNFEAVDEYKRSLDINKAISEGKRFADIQKRKLEAEQAKARAKAEADAKAEAEKVDASKFMTPPTEPAKETPADGGQWIKFAALLTVEQAKELKAFFNERNIEFKPV